MEKPIDTYSHFYFLGIGGIGMSALARFFHRQGKAVSGYDKTETGLTRQLVQEGIMVSYSESEQALPSFLGQAEAIGHTLIVLTPAIPAEHEGWLALKHRGFTFMKRSEVLGAITRSYKTMAVAGTHGKTTTSSLLAHIFQSAGLSCTAFLGGISANTGSNVLMGNPADSNHRVVVEADEYDRSFLTLHPAMAIITSMDPDHLDIYGDEVEMRNAYRQFASQVDNDGMVIYRSGLPLETLRGHSRRYAIEDSHADYFAENIHVSDGRYEFDLVTPGYRLEKLRLGLAGRHNVENAVAASALALESGLDPLQLPEALESYLGVQRRFEFHLREANRVYIDDYAHHPAELEATIRSARELFPGKRITGVFQPHLFTRTRDFADGFCASLSLLDTVYLLDIYPAREKPIEGVDSHLLVRGIKAGKAKIVTKEEVVEIIRQDKPEVLLSLGAGDIDQLIQPFKEAMRS